MNRRKERGFTRIEMIVVVAVIAVLAAVLTPFIRRSINDSRVAKARSDVQTIAGALTDFFRDTGSWPDRNAAGETVAYLYTGNTAPGAGGIFSAAAPPLDPPVADWGATGAPLDNSLLTNGAGNAYPPSGDMRWKGPYVGGALPVDPWGGPYVVNAAPAGPIWVLSAGPNRRIQTAVADNAVRDDDIGLRVR